MTDKMALGNCANCGDPMEGHGFWDSCRQPAKVLERAMRVVNEQAGEEMLWFMAQTPGEEILQIALRRLHAAVEGKSPEQCAREALAKIHN